MSDFDKWFNAQHGTRIKKLGLMPDSQLEEEIFNGREAERELRHRKLWDATYKSALYGWTAARNAAGKNEQ